jgi:hypothetical protein
LGLTQPVYVIETYDDVAVVESNASRGCELIHGATGPDFLYREVHHTLPDIEAQHQGAFAELHVEILDPALEIFRVERAHVPDKNGVQELANGLALLLTGGMEGAHAAVLEQDKCPGPARRRDHVCSHRSQSRFLRAKFV